MLATNTFPRSQVFGNDTMRCALILDGQQTVFRDFAELNSSNSVENIMKYVSQRRISWKQYRWRQLMRQILPGVRILCVYFEQKELPSCNVRQWKFVRVKCFENASEWILPIPQSTKKKNMWVVSEKQISKGRFDYWLSSGPSPPKFDLYASDVESLLETQYENHLKLFMFLLI